MPGCALASDQPYRESDLAIDYCEDVPRLDSAAVARIVGMFEAAGAHAKVSSIHVNGWFADCDKLSMVRRYMRECHGVDLDAERDRYLYIGDSPNDAPMFGYFPIAVGVANVMAFAGEIEPMPAFITDAPCGDGFRQMVDWLVGDERGS